MKDPYCNCDKPEFKKVNQSLIHVRMEDICTKCKKLKKPADWVKSKDEVPPIPKVSSLPHLQDDKKEKKDKTPKTYQEYIDSITKNIDKLKIKGAKSENIDDSNDAFPHWLWKSY